MSVGEAELCKDTGDGLKRVWLVSRDFRNCGRKTGGVSAGWMGVCGNEVLKGCRLAPSAKGEMGIDNQAQREA